MQRTNFHCSGLACDPLIARLPRGMSAQPGAGDSYR
jgi:hypothetical protein